MLKFKDLKTLPYRLLRIIALRLASDIDAGDDKRHVLEQVFNAIKVAQ